MIPKSGSRFSEKIMLQQGAKTGWRFEEKSSRFSPPNRAASSPHCAALQAGCAVLRSARGRYLGGRAADDFRIGVDRQRFAEQETLDLIAAFTREELHLVV